ncbi:hypothetical protein A0H81_01613 [Grifola frondosa]|uniref:Uncharacterized protein n=1 Tax=Grifola frondosa TaxID=5627 RepID=A0A1C7MN81_GRIFR|nr:hypothetical protein A0H81_01613 [Grifola frondosa]
MLSRLPSRNLRPPPKQKESRPSRRARVRAARSPPPKPRRRRATHPTLRRSRTSWVGPAKGRAKRNNRNAG